MMPIKILHLITGLDIGGAELVLARLVTHLDPNVYQSHVVSMIPSGSVGAQLQEKGMALESLSMLPGRITLPGLINLIKIIRRYQPDILQTWLYHADLMGLIIGRLTGKVAVIWNIRNSDMDFSKYRLLTRLVMKACALLSPFPDTVIVNSMAGKESHKRNGYRPRRWEYLPNGVDTDLFSPDEFAGRRVRSEWGINEGEICIGMVGRLDPQKDHVTFLQAARLVLAKCPQVRFICVGTGPVEYRDKLTKLSRQLGLDRYMVWTGVRTDMPAVYNAFDLLVLSSVYGEGFPNVVAEAMSCDIPCVVTNVGDAGLIVQNDRLIAEPGNPQQLAEKILDALRNGHPVLREHIKQHYSLQLMVDRYANLYHDLVSGVLH